jgi:hypothetical protein
MLADMSQDVRSDRRVVQVDDAEASTAWGQMLADTGWHPGSRLRQRPVQPLDHLYGNRHRNRAGVDDEMIQAGI